jgi:hypothetical protein
VSGAGGPELTLVAEVLPIQNAPSTPMVQGNIP